MSLHVKRLTSIGAVYEGDNPEADIMLWKRRGKKEPVATVKQWLHSIRGEDIASSKGTHMDFDKLGIPDDAREAIESEIAKLQSKIVELSEPVDTDVLKGVSDEAKAEFEKQNAKLVEMEKAAKVQADELVKERDARLTAEFSKTAESYTRILGDDGGALLKAFSEHTDEYETLIEKLDAISIIVETSDLFKELGVNDQADPKEQIEALAKEKQKDNPKLTLTQAKVLVRKERTDLRDLEREMV